MREVRCGPKLWPKETGYPHPDEQGHDRVTLPWLQTPLRAGGVPGTQPGCVQEDVYLSDMKKLTSHGTVCAAVCVDQRRKLPEATADQRQLPT
jgi:hypothetical protein